MAKKDIQKALEEASAETTVELTPRQKMLAARKMNLQRKRRQKLPKALR
tara:strand:- start:999 stop:1145 length:147 start_codon:yes stop_codon:yes gene_type:complete